MCGHQRLVTPTSVTGHEVHRVVLVVISGIGTALVDLPLDDGGGTALAWLTASYPLLVTLLILCQPITLEALGSCYEKKYMTLIHGLQLILFFFCN